MTRVILPTRRRSVTFSFGHAPDVGLPPTQYTATIGYLPDGAIAEVFLNSKKVGSGTDSAARDAAIAVSIAIQHGTPLATLRHAMTRNGDGSASSPIGQLLDALDKEASAA